jgi:uncharacterized protein (DUF342 family)
MTSSRCGDEYERASRFKVEKSNEVKQDVEIRDSSSEASAMLALVALEEGREGERVIREALLAEINCY